MKIHIEISRKVKPAMPLTSLGESNIPSGLKVDNIPSPNKITANIKTRNPKTTSSVFMKISHPLNQIEYIFHIRSIFIKKFLLKLQLFIPLS